MAMYKACVVSTLLFVSESLTSALGTLSLQDTPLLGISWKDEVPNTEVLFRAAFPPYTLLRRHRPRWLGHVH